MPQKSPRQSLGALCCVPGTALHLFQLGKAQVQLFEACFTRELHFNDASFFQADDKTLPKLLVPNFAVAPNWVGKS